MRQSNKGMMALAAVMALAASTEGIAPELVGRNPLLQSPRKVYPAIKRHQGNKEMERRARKMAREGKQP